MQSDITLEETELYADVSEKMRRFVEKYFQLQQPLNMTYTHHLSRPNFSRN